MMKLTSIRFFQLYLGLCLLLVGCEQGLQKEQLRGEWQAVSLLEDGQPLELDLTPVTLTLGQSGYQFTSTLNYREQGSYRLQSNLLLTKDTLGKNPAEKAVEISELRKDSLYVRMNEAGKERILILKKK